MAQGEERMNSQTKIKLFLAVHWRGIFCVLVPLILIPIVLPYPPPKWKWVAYCLVLMATFWVSECIPLAVTSFFPVLIFPLTGVLTTAEVCKSYVNDTIIMFLGSLMLAYSVEQSGLHKRLAYCAIRSIGYSHTKLLFAMCLTTMFVSMWITNTAATTMMVPITFALLKVFEDEKILHMYDVDEDGEKVASDITTCYFCAITFSATIGGIGTLVGTGTNLTFKGLFVSDYPNAPEYLSFPKFSAFAVPYMLVLELLAYIYMAYVYFGLFRASSDVARAARITKSAERAAKNTIEAEWNRIGSITYWEWMVIFLFGGAMVAFFSRSPQIFRGWGDAISEHFGYTDMKFVKDSALAMFVAFLMCLLPATTDFWQNCNVSHREDLPKGTIRSVLDWKEMNATMPFSFTFLLGGGFALSDAAKLSGLNAKIGEFLKILQALPNVFVLLLIIIVVVFVTNFASNVAVINVFGPIAMQLGKAMSQNPLWYLIAAGYSASFCFMIPVGTPGNLIVQSAAKVPTSKMMKAGAGPTVTTILITWLSVYYWAPIIWPDLVMMPFWTGGLFNGTIINIT